MRSFNQTSEARLALFVFAMVIFVSCGYDGPKLSVAELKAKIDSSPASLAIVDVRRRVQFDAGHIEGAVNIPLEEIESRTREIKPNVRTIALICTCGRRSLKAVKKLKALGLNPFLGVGGMKEWGKAGYPTDLERK